MHTAPSYWASSVVDAVHDRANGVCVCVCVCVKCVCTYVCEVCVYICLCEESEMHTHVQASLHTFVGICSTVECGDSVVSDIVSL